MSRPDPIEVEEARRIVCEAAQPLPAEPVFLRDALGRTLAEDVVAAEPVPGFDNSAMDGFAVRAADVRGAGAGPPRELRIVDESRAGRPSTRALGTGEAIAISTGAMLPAGADAVVRIEDTSVEGERALVRTEVDPGRDVRRVGEDIEAGSVVLRRGLRLGAAELGVLAGAGRSAASCHRRPRVSVLTSGDELVEPGAAMHAGGVRDSNGQSVPALAALEGADVVNVDRVADDRGATRAAVTGALGAGDVAIVCGGVSVGEHDHVRPALAELGVEQRFWGVALKPGKPTWFGTAGETLVFGLPGNPVSAIVTFVLFVRPALAVLAGERPERRRTTAVLAEGRERLPRRAQAVRCRLELGEDGWLAHPFERQGSHVLTSMLGAGCLAFVPAGSGEMKAGDRVEVELLGRG